MSKKASKTQQKKKVRLQTQIDEQLKDQAEESFWKEGLTLNDGVRFLLTQYVNGKFSINITPEYEEYEMSEYSKKMVEEAMENRDRALVVEDLNDLDELL